MPYKPRRPCKHPNCPELVPYGQAYCDTHKPLHPTTEQRPSANSRGYTKRWQKASKQYLQVHPLCVRCLAAGRLRTATVVDHITPHRGDQTLFWDKNNWQALCKPCHDRKTWTEDSHPTYHY